MGLGTFWFWTFNVLGVIWIFMFSKLFKLACVYVWPQFCGTRGVYGKWTEKSGRTDVLILRLPTHDFSLPFICHSFFYFTSCVCIVYVLLLAGYVTSSGYFPQQCLFSLCSIYCASLVYFIKLTLRKHLGNVLFSHYMISLEYIYPNIWNQFCMLTLCIIINWQFLWIFKANHLL